MRPRRVASVGVQLRRGAAACGCAHHPGPSSEFDSWMRLVISESSCVCSRRCVRVYVRVRVHTCPRVRPSKSIHARATTNGASDGPRHSRRGAGRRVRGEGTRFGLVHWRHSRGDARVHVHAHPARGTRKSIPRREVGYDGKTIKGSRVSLYYSLNDVDVVFWVAGDQMSETRRMLMHARNFHHPVFIHCCLPYTDKYATLFQCG